MSNPKFLPDTRPYPIEPVKNDLLLHAEQVGQGKGAQSRLASETLRAQIYGMLSQNFYLNLSVAMSMAPSQAAYAALLNALSDVLQAKTDDEVQWFALPVVLVAGTKKETSLTTQTPALELSACLANYPHTRTLAHATWLPHLLSASDMANINAGQWFQAKQNAQAAADFATSLPQTKHLLIAQDQSVSIAFALGYGGRELIDVLGKNLQEAALPLMQVWQQALHSPSVTLFTNPLSPNTPTLALPEASHMRSRMALDVFAANSIRAIRLQSPRVGVVMAAQAGGSLLFGFNATDSQFEVQPQIFSWALSSLDNIEIIQQNFLDLMVECQVENIRLLHNPIADNEELPTYAQSLHLAGHNPLFSDGNHA